jgi:hypothetical protein
MMTNEPNYQTILFIRPTQTDKHSLSLNFSGIADSLPSRLSGYAIPISSKPLLYRGPLPTSSFLVPRTPSPFVLCGTADPHSAQPLWFRGPPPLLNFPTPRTLSPFNLSGSANTLPSYLFGSADPLSSLPLWFREPPLLSSYLVSGSPTPESLIRFD